MEEESGMVQELSSTLSIKVCLLPPFFVYLFISVPDECRRPTESVLLGCFFTNWIIKPNI